MTSRLAFHSDNGAVYPLDGSDGIQAVNLIDGLTTIPTDLIIEQRVGGDGGTLTNARRGPRRLTLDFMIPDPDPQVVLQLWGRLQVALALGGKLVYDGPNGVRELRQVILESAIRIMVGPDEIDDVFSTSLIALDPYWYGSLQFREILFDEATDWDADEDWNADIPWNGGSSTTIEINGDEETYPVFVAEGPATLITVALDDNLWELDNPMTDDGSAQDYATVDHRPGHRGPRWGTNLLAGADPPGLLADWSMLSEQSRIDWGLQTGSIDLIVGGTETDPAATRLWVFWEPRHLTP